MRLFLSLLIVSCTAFTLSAQENPLSAFEPFVGKTWKAQGTWGDGSKFLQVTTLEYDLSKKIVIAKAKGYTDENRTITGPRNHGVRKYDESTGKILFWEFDVFGGVTTGEVTFEQNSMYYTYDYGGTIVTDGWVKQENDEYIFMVGTREEGKWSQVFLECPLTRE